MVYIFVNVCFFTVNKKECRLYMNWFVMFSIVYIHLSYILIMNPLFKIVGEFELPHFNLGFYEI